MAAAPLKKVFIQNADGYKEVAARKTPSSKAVWDLPGGIVADLLDEWTQCEYANSIGYIKTKNLPGVEKLDPGAMVDVKDSYAANTKTCMRWRPEQQTSGGNTMRFVPNGPGMVKLIDCWAEVSFRGFNCFVKARHVQPAPANETAGDAGAAAAPVAPASGTSACFVCGDTVNSIAGVVCPAGDHFFCAGCLSDLLKSFKNSEYAEQKMGKGRVLCPMKDSESPFGDAALIPHVPQDVFDDYVKVRVAVAEKGIQEQIEQQYAAKMEELKERLAKAEGTAEQNELDNHRLKIIDDIFTLRCPSCKAAFVDYDHCSALTCAFCKCGFCAYCLKDCGKDAHAHFFDNGSKCPKEGGPLFIDQKGWLAFHARRKGRLLRKYLKKVPEPLRKKLCGHVAFDAEDLGIDMPKDLSLEALAAKPEGGDEVLLILKKKKIDAWPSSGRMPV
eukprot:CAMPEP_0170297090 /NCGR_PEP_ID=MMETSP0116_2-20130129/48706_1 /TAXON_ID=400756 /ORGANISM="Durinskia baltica, Strain CSIRO CS-38" /LENGTH=443 /DNA_ID=CAMNT_0010548715 /DNA_START=1 /DNA_END=1333 /DNA_ORIENTATION=-